MPPRRHFPLGVPLNVEEVTWRARMVYNKGKESCIILHSFATHKECKRWYKSF